MREREREKRARERLGELNEVEPERDGRNSNKKLQRKTEYIYLEMAESCKRLVKNERIGEK